MKIASGIVSFLLSSQVFATSSWSPADFVPDFRTAAAVADINWNVGDKAGYNVDFGVARGTMKSSVDRKEGENFWINQALSLGSAGDHLMEMLVNPSTGEVLKLIVDGEEKDPPKSPASEVVSSSEEQVTVPAGTFNTIHVVTKEVESGKTSDSWINELEIPVFGLVKAVEPGQFGKVYVDLTDFDFANR